MASALFVGLHGPDRQAAWCALEAAGHTVSEVATETFLRLVRQDPVDLVVIDVSPLAHAVHLVGIAEPDAGLMLVSLLRDAEAKDLCVLPKRKDLWQGPRGWARPAWVRLPQKTAEARGPDRHPWHPELDFAVGMADGARRELLLTINGWIKARRATALHVPIKERSLEITGDEKVLDANRQGRALFGGRLPLDALRCYVVPLPMPCETETQARGRPALILENADSFTSFCAWNRQARALSAVLYAAAGTRSRSPTKRAISIS